MTRQEANALFSGLQTMMALVFIVSAVQASNLWTVIGFCFAAVCAASAVCLWKK